MRVVLDSHLRSPTTANVFDNDAPTLVLTTAQADERRRAELRGAGVGVQDVAAGPGGVDLPAAFAELRNRGIGSLMVEGGAAVITSLFTAALVDRLVVSVSPTIVGSGIEAVGDLRLGRIADGIRLTNRGVHLTDEDVLLSWDVQPAR
jgi:riboflavin biosynthesis pyrimidine reductase